jgi:hypothetical protein
MEPSVNVSVVDELVKLVFAVVGPIIAAAATALFVRLFRKAGIELDMTKQAVIEQKLGDAVALTEEWASIRLKNGIPISAQQKAEHYLGVVADTVPNVTPEEATAIAKTILGRFRVAASGSLSDVRSAAVTQ